MSESTGGRKAPIRKVAIIGTAESMSQCPFHDETWDIFAPQVALSYPACKRVTRVFELHPQNYWRDRPEVVKRILTADVPCMMQEEFKVIPKSERFPLSEMVEWFSERRVARPRYFTNSIAMMIAYAIYQGYEMMGLFGVHMSGEEEYAHQRPCCEYWLGIANGMGIVTDLATHPKNMLLKANTMYGYESESKVVSEIRDMIRGLEVGARELQKDVDAKREEYWKQAGAVDILRQMERKLR